MGGCEFADLFGISGMKDSSTFCHCASETFLSTSGMFGAWTWVGTVLHRSPSTVASMDSGLLDMVNQVPQMTAHSLTCSFSFLDNMCIGVLRLLKLRLSEI